MASKRNELVKLLESNGFYLKRQTKHAQYFDGYTRITMPTGGGFDGRLEKMIKLQIRDAVEKRNKLNQGQGSL